MSAAANHRDRCERGQAAVIFALLLPMVLALAGVVIGIGNWYVHAKNLQTKADAGAFAGGSAWSFPCVSTDTSIVDQARLYAGPTSVTPAGVNPQVGGVPGASVHTVLNATDWYDDDNTPPSPPEFVSPSGSVCDAKILDVKVTEDNSFPLASLIPLFPDIKRKARVRIEESKSSSESLLPLAVRVPKPLSAAALYVDETPGVNYGRVLSARYFTDVCEPPNFTGCLSPMPTGLDHWTTDDGAGGNRADIANMPSQVGVVVGLSFRPACPGASPCFSINTSTYPTIDQMCNQGTSALVQCFYTTGNSTQTFQSGLQFIRSYSTNADAAPDLLRVWFDGATGTNCYQGGYFSAPVANPCDVLLHAEIDPGFNGVGNYEIRYKLVSGNTSWQEDDAPGACNSNFGANCDMTSGVANVRLNQAYARHAVAIAIYRYNIPLAVRQANGLPSECGNTSRTDACSWYFPDNGGAARGFNNPPTTNQGNANIFSHPVQRAFMGDINKSGPVKFLHLFNVDCTSGTVLAGVTETGLAASVLAGRRCFKLEMGLQGALARDQDEQPIQLNIGATSQTAVVDCDPSIPNIKDEIVMGCGGDDGFPTYKKHDFAVTPYCPNVSGANQFFSLPKSPPWDAWEPFTCVLTQASASVNQIMQGFNERFFGVSNNPRCPADDAQFVPGRNYWHDLNNEFVGDPDGPGPEPMQADYWTFARSSRNHGNHLRNDDPRFVLLFISPYNSFTGNGNETYPITAVGGFYITGYGRASGNGSLAIEDPCSTGAGQSVGAGNTPPPDADLSTSGAVAWGHFVVPIDLGASGGGTGVLCEPSAPGSCVAVLIE
jgi:Putative Flp pilus-assembly TadE/G-like